MKPHVPPSSTLPKHFLVAVDAEGLSDTAVRAVVPIAHDLGARVSFVHAIGNPILEWGYAESPRAVSTASALTDKVGRALSEHVHKLLAAAGRKVPADELVHVEVGRPGKVLHERASEIGADCVVLGKLGKRRLFDFGSTARAVLGHAATVWVQPSDPRPIRRILVPVDLSDASLSALSLACLLAKKLKAGVRALHCFDSMPVMMTPLAGYPEIGASLPIEEMRASSESAFASAMAGFDWHGVQHETSFFDARPEDKIAEFQDSSDLIVMSTRGRTGLAGAVMGHVAYSVLKDARIPVWAIHQS